LQRSFWARIALERDAKQPCLDESRAVPQSQRSFFASDEKMNLREQFSSGVGADRLRIVHLASQPVAKQFQACRRKPAFSPDCQRAAVIIYPSQQTKSLILSK